MTALLQGSHVTNCLFKVVLFRCSPFLFPVESLESQNSSKCNSVVSSHRMPVSLGKVVVAEESPGETLTQKP